MRRASETLGLGARNLVASRAGIALRGNEMKWLSMILIGFRVSLSTIIVSPDS